MSYDNPSSSRPLAAVVLAAGKGKRMNSDLPKVVHHVAGHPMVWWVVQAVRQSGAAPIVLVVGHGANFVREAFAIDDRDLMFAVQEDQLGTGHATLCARPALDDFDGDVLVLAGDGPLIRPATIERMREIHARTGAAATLATSVIDDPTGYGRVVRDADGRFLRIVEHRNASDDERTIREIYPSYALFDAEALFSMLEALEPDAASSEYYVTEVPAQLASRGFRVEVVEAVPPEDVLSVNTPEQLAEVDSILTRRLAPAGKEIP